MTTAEMIDLIVMLNCEGILQFSPGKRSASGPANVEVEGKSHNNLNSRQ